jgi:hypothetical protein
MVRSMANYHEYCVVEIDDPFDVGVGTGDTPDAADADDPAQMRICVMLGPGRPINPGLAVKNAGGDGAT